MTRSTARWAVSNRIRRRDQGLAVAYRLKNGSFVELDVLDESSISRAAKEVSELDFLINNAAVIAEGDKDIRRIRPEIMLRSIDTNALGALRVAQAFLPLLLKSPAGRIINVSGGAVQLSDPSTWSPAYSLSKTAMNGITSQLAEVLKEKGIGVDSVCPGWCRTERGGPDAPRSVEQGADGIAWLAVEAPQEKTGLFWRDRQVILW